MRQYSEAFLQAPESEVLQQDHARSDAANIVWAELKKEQTLAAASKVPGHDSRTRIVMISAQTSTPFLSSFTVAGFGDSPSIREVEQNYCLLFLVLLASIRCRCLAWNDVNAGYTWMTLDSWRDPFSFALDSDVRKWILPHNQVTAVTKSNCRCYISVKFDGAFLVWSATYSEAQPGYSENNGFQVLCSHSWLPWDADVWLEMLVAATPERYRIEDLIHWIFHLILYLLKSRSVFFFTFHIF